MNKLKLLFIVLLSAFLINTSQSSESKSVFKYYIIGNPTSIDPTYSSDIVSGTVVNQLFEGLTRINYKGELIPAGAESWFVSDNNLKWTFYLRKNAKWSNGSPVTAHDYVYAWRRLADKSTQSSYSYYINDLKLHNAAEIIAGKEDPRILGIRAIDDYTLEINLYAPNPNLLQMVSLSLVMPLPEKVIEKYGDKKWILPENFVSNGAFKLNKYILNGNISLVKSNTYWDKDNVKLDIVNLEIYKTESQALTAFITGDLDALEIFPENIYKLGNINEKYNTVTFNSAISNWYAFNTKKPPFNNINVRKAISLALDSNRIALDSINTGVASGSIVSPLVNNADLIEDNSYYQRSIFSRVEEAKELLEKEGYSVDNKLNFTITYNNSDIQKRIAISAQYILSKELGSLVNVKLDALDWSYFFLNRQQGNFDLASVYWTPDYNDAYSFLSIFVSNNALNYVGFNNKEYDKLASDSSYSIGLDKQKIYSKMNNILSDNYVVIPLYFDNKTYILDKKIEGWTSNDLVRRYYKDVYFKK